MVAASAGRLERSVEAADVGLLCPRHPFVPGHCYANDIMYPDALSASRSSSSSPAIDSSGHGEGGHGAGERECEGEGEGEGESACEGESECEGDNNTTTIVNPHQTSFSFTDTHISSKRKTAYLANMLEQYMIETNLYLRSF